MKDYHIIIKIVYDYQDYYMVIKVLYTDFPSGLLLDKRLYQNFFLILSK